MSPGDAPRFSASAGPAALYDVRETAAFALLRAGRSLRRFLDPSRQEIGLQPGRDLVLLEAVRRSATGEVGARACDLEAALEVRANTLSRMLDGMRRDGWLIRERDPADGRAWRLAPTAQGISVAALAAEMWRDADRVVEQVVGGGRLLDLGRLLREAAWMLAASAEPSREASGVTRAPPTLEMLVSAPDERHG